MSEKDSILSIRLSNFQRKEIDELLKKFTKSTERNKGDLILDLLLFAEKYRYFDKEKDWKANVIEDELSLYASKEQIRINGELVLMDLREASKDKDRKFNYFKEYLKSRTESERREIWDRELHLQRGEEIQALPARIEGGFEVYINGKRVVVKEILKDGFPKLEFNQDRLVKCLAGFHTKGSWCDKCEQIPTCPVVRDERLERLGRQRR